MEENKKLTETEKRLQELEERHDIFMFKYEKLKDMMLAKIALEKPPTEEGGDEGEA